MVEEGKGARPPVRCFEDLLVWQKAMALVKTLYDATREGPWLRDYALRDQLRRAAVSIPTNIAEGFERSTRKEYLQFLNIAKGSAGEVRSLLSVAESVGYLDPPSHAPLRAAVTEVSRYLANLMASLKEIDR